MDARGFGFLVPQRLATLGGADVSDVTRLGIEAEASGVFDSVWVGDSLTAKPRPDSITLLAALAATTHRVRLGTACMASFPLRDPAIFAYQWATLDRLSAGRMTLGVCTGLAAGRDGAREAAFWGVDPTERPLRLEEHLRLCRMLWTGDPVRIEGRLHRYTGMRLEPTPSQNPCPVLIGANPWQPRHAERVMRRVASMGDGWLTVNSWPGMLPALRARLVEHLAACGRDIGNFPIYAMHNVNIGSDREACLADAHAFLDAHQNTRSPRQMVTAWTAAGSPDRCADDLQAVLDQGVDHLILRIASADQDGQWRLLTEEVMPRMLSRVR